MSDTIFAPPKAFVTRKRSAHIPITLIKGGDYKGWLKKQPKALKNQAEEESFNPTGKHILVVKNNHGRAKHIYAGVHDNIRLYDLANCVSDIQKAFSSAFLKKCSFEFKANGFDGEALTRAHIGWGLAGYQFKAYKKPKAAIPALLWHTKADKKRVKTFVESICMLKDMVNIPANDMGPDEMEDASKTVAASCKAKIKIIKDKQLLDQNFPLVHAVGDASPRRPRLIELTWGNKTNPKVVLVGKGVAFDTGGLNLKPGKYMDLMKKDMAGAAHALALARIIMELELPICLRVLLPVVENSVSGESFRPGDAMQSRKGLIVENKNTDAEGRLILADALTAASEDKPDLIIDFCTLTGSARAALGPDIPAMFSNNDEIGRDLQNISMEETDPVWQMPLWAPYKKYIESPVGDLVNSASLPGDLIYSSLFLQSFLVGKPNWIHLDIYSWESSGRPGRPKGAADTGLRAVFAFLENRYAA